MQNDEIFEKVQDTLAGALGVSKDDITLEASLTKDLGAESIDFIDIIFRLEKTFDIKIPSGDLFPAHVLNNDRFVKDGRVTEAGLQELRSKMPYLNLEQFQKNPQVQFLSQYFTVQMIADYVQGRVGKGVQA